MRRATATTIGIGILATALAAAPLLSVAQPTADPRAIWAHALDPATDPVADGLAAAQRGDYRLIVTGFYGWGTPYTAYGITCDTPYQQAPQTLVEFAMSDAIGPEGRALHAYAAGYNQTLVGHPDYPDAYLCHPTADNRAVGLDRPLAATATAQAGEPPRSLHEAARRFGAAEVRFWLAITPVDQLDSLGMSALAWATAHSNRATAEILLAAGADPWIGSTSAVYWAARLGQGDTFATMSRLLGRRFTAWPTEYMNAAMRGGSLAIVSAILAEPHEQLDISQVNEAPRPEIVAPFLADDPSLVAPMFQAVIRYYNPRADLLQLALAYGADPDVRGSDEVMLRHVASGGLLQSVEITAALLNAGADPNLDLPIRRAISSLRSENHGGAFVRARAIFDLLIAAGADLNLTDGRRPLIWEVLFPLSFRPRELNANSFTPALVELLASQGLDLNAEYEGDRVLALVEAQAGANSVIAIALRRLGAI